MITILIERLKHFGEIPLCNGISERAPHFFNFCFPLCYRCSALLFMFFITYFINLKKFDHKPIIFLILCLLPMIIDGCLQTFYGIESTNLRRVVTGGLFGYGLGMLLSSLLIKLDNHK